MDRARKNLAVLVAAQAVLGSQTVMMIVIGGLVGIELAPNTCLATAPVTLVLIGSMTTAPWLSAVMQRSGRRAGFTIGTAAGAAGAALATFAIAYDSFLGLLAAAYLSGIAMSTQQFFRFAAADTASEEFRPKAISLTLVGGLVAALIGPQLISLLSGNSPIATAERYVPVYWGAAILCLATTLLVQMLDIPPPAPPKDSATPIRTRRELLADPAILVAILCATVSYALMNLIMTATPLAVVGCGFQVADAANVVSAHILAMYGPSLFTGHLIARFGARTIVAIGLACLFASGVVAVQGIALSNFFGALILLGLGWNFGFIGGTSLLSESQRPEEQGRVQGLNDLIVFGAVAVASLASGGLLNCTGTGPEAGWITVNMMIFPLLALAGGAMIWLTFRAPRRA